VLKIFVLYASLFTFLVSFLSVWFLHHLVSLVHLRGFLLVTYCVEKNISNDFTSQRFKVSLIISLILLSNQFTGLAFLISFASKLLIFSYLLYDLGFFFIKFSCLAFRLSMRLICMCIVSICINLDQNWVFLMTITISCEWNLRNEKILVAEPACMIAFQFLIACWTDLFMLLIIVNCYLFSLGGGGSYFITATWGGIHSI